MRYDEFGQAEQGSLPRYPVLLGPGAQPHAAHPQRLGGQHHILGGDGPVNDPVVRCRRKGPSQIAADQDAGCRAPQRPGRVAVGVGHRGQGLFVLYDHKAPVPCVDAAGARHARTQYGAQRFRGNRPVGIPPHAPAGKDCL